MHIELNTQFCPKNVAIERVFLFLNKRPAILFKNKSTRSSNIFETKLRI